MKIYDLIGVGFGPSNIALSITLEEKCHTDNKSMDVLFLEKQASFAWHPNMLLKDADMQISFLKDLATPRNPSSKYTFLNYLHSKGRLQSFTNLKTFFPSRYEFNDYLTWCASHFDHICEYNREVTSITPVLHEEDSQNVQLLKVNSKDVNGNEQEYLTRSIVIAVGGYGFIPDSFKHVKNDSRVFHSSTYLKELNKQKNLEKVAVIGAGQSAAEIFMDLYSNQVPNIDLITRSWAFKPSDDSPFVNEIFNPEFTDYVFNNSTDKRAELAAEYKSTNYAAPDLDLIQQIYNVFYEQQVIDKHPHSLLRGYEVSNAELTEEGVTLKINDLNNSGTSINNTYDAVILATGYLRNTHEKLLAPVKRYMSDYTIERNYNIVSDEGFQPIVFLQGCCESTHGLSDTLLSNLSVRTEEIYEQLKKHLS